MTEQTNEDDQVTRDTVRTEISKMSFEDLQKLKEEIGLQALNEKIFGKKSDKSIKTNTSFKRLNKNRPREMSSKIPPKESAPKTEKYRLNMPRDPRFDPLCGTFNEKIFNKSYKFVDEIKEKEREMLKKQLKDVEDAKQQRKIKYLIQRLDNQIRDKKKKDKAEDAVSSLEKRNSKEKKTYKRKSERKMIDLLTKYEELKKNKRLEKHITKKSKKLNKKKE